MSRLVCIVAPHFTAGVVVGERAAPIISYMSRWPIARIENYCRSKRWQYEVVEARWVGAGKAGGE